MITLRKNPNFSNWIQVIAFGQFIDEVQGKANALRIAKDLAHKNNLTHINSFGTARKVR